MKPQFQDVLISIMLIKITYVVIILIVKTTIINTRINRILKSVNDQTCDNAISEKVMQVVNTCFTDTLDMIVFAGTFCNFKNWRTNFSPLLKMYYVGLSESILFNRHKRLDNAYTLDENVVSKLRYPSKLFIVSSISEIDSFILLDKLKQSVLWNSRAIFFLVKEDLKKQCSTASFELNEAWKFNILNAFYICSNENEIQIYTFNPFTKVSPDSWKMLETINVNYKDRNDSLSIFRYSCTLTVVDRSTCECLNLDKSAEFNGYTIQIVAFYKHNMFQRIDGSNSSNSYPQPLSQFNGLNAEIINATLHKLHLTALVTLNNNKGSIGENNTVHGIINNLLKEKFDMGANERYRRGFWRLETYPHDVSDLCVMTIRRIHHLPIIHGFTLLMTLQAQVLKIFILVIFAEILILMYVLKLKFIAVALECLRILIGTSTYKGPDHSSHGLRLLFLSIVLFNFWINLYFGIQLTSSFAIKRDDPNIDSIEDLIESGYEVAGDKSFKEFLHKDSLRDRFKEITIDCLEYMLTKGNVACLNNCYETDYLSRKYRSGSIHVSDPLYSTYVAFIVREDWPLLPRINDIIQRLKESGITQHFDDNNFYHSSSFYAERKRDDMKMNNDVGFIGKPLTPNKMIHSFYIYCYGVVGSLTAFLTEFSWKYISRSSTCKKISDNGV